MCLGSTDTKVKMPEPKEQPDPIPAPPPPTEIAAPKPLTDPGDTVDIRIGSAAKGSTSRRDRDQDTTGSTESLTISSNQGLNL